MNPVKLSLLFLSLFFSATALPGQKLIPMPKEIHNTKGIFRIPSEIQIKHNTATENAQHLSDFFAAKNILVLPSRNKTKGKSLLLNKAANPKALKAQLKTAGLDSDFHPEEEGYVLSITPQKIQIFTLTEAGAFYGIQTLKQLFNQYAANASIPAMNIYDKPDIAIRAWQDDISRGPIPTMETLKEQIRFMSSVKLNYFTLYTEHVYKLEQHPKIAPADGISKEELQELIEYAAQHHVNMIGNYQSFGHMEETLCHPDYQHLAENEHIISPALEESYEFLEDVYEEMVPQYNNEYFNINCDETFGLGQGKSKAMVDSMGVAGVYVHHINKLDDLLKKYNKKILMWGDIAASYPEIVQALPKDMTVIPWAYHGIDSYDEIIKPISDQQLNFWVAPGVGCWLNVFPNFHEAQINIYN